MKASEFKGRRKFTKAPVQYEFYTEPGAQRLKLFSDPSMATSQNPIEMDGNITDDVIFRTGSSTGKLPFGFRLSCTPFKYTNLKDHQSFMREVQHLKVTMQH